MTNWALALAAAISVLAFGGVETLGLLPAQVLVLAAFLGDCWRHGWPSVGRRIGLILVLLAVLPALQLLPLPQAVLGALSPARLRLNRELSGDASPPLQLASALSVNPHETQLALLRLLFYMMVFLLAFRASERDGHPGGRREGGARRKSSWLPPVLVGLGIFEAVYGLVQYLAGWQYIFTYAKRYNTSMASGTYINYNHYAGLLEMVLPFVLAPMLLEERARAGMRISRWKEMLISPASGLWAVRLLVFTLVSLALIFSRSRSGILAAAAGIMVLAILSLAARGRWLVMATSLALIALFLLYSAWIGVAPVLERFQSLSGGAPGEQLRPAIWRDTLHLISDYPLFGTGLGTYRWSSFRYQTAALTLRYEHAHNDYLEFAADLGIPAALLLFTGLWFLALQAARLSLRLRPPNRALAAACAAAMIALLLHSLTDFNLQIPANAMIFSWIAGTAAGLARRKNASRDPRHAGTGRQGASASVVGRRGVVVAPSQLRLGLENSP